MGCLSAHITRQDALTAHVTPQAFSKASSKRVNALGGIVYRLDALEGKSERLCALSAYVSHVCAVRSTPFLRVTPKEVMWITDYDTIAYDVYSNQSWVVEQIPQETI